MESKVKIKKEYTLVLNQEEADWLKNYLQNSPAGEKEHPKNTKIRKSFWDALNPPEEVSS